MSLPTKLFPLLLCLMLVACGGGGGGSSNQTPLPPAPPSPPAPLPGATFSFRTPTSADLAQVQTGWAQRDLSSQDVSVVYQANEATYQVKIYRHRVGSSVHFGAVVSPLETPGSAPASGSTPVIVLLDGLGPEPTVNFDPLVAGHWPGTILVIPAFRGRAANYKGRLFQSTGEFCDGWDGPTDDAISLLNVVAAHEPTANVRNVVLSGYSRGGTVALLMAARDSRARSVVSGGGPTDFYRADIRDVNGTWYVCQFFTGLDEAGSRRRILGSSPVRFPMKASVRKVHLLYGEQDTVAPPWNAVIMNEALVAQGVPVSYQRFSGGHGTVWENPAFVPAWEAAHREALLSLQQP